MLDFASEPAWQLPSGADLPDTDGIPTDNEIHRETVSKYLIDPLKRWFKLQGIEAFVGGNSFVYYPPPKSLKSKVKVKPRRLGPDFYVVLGGESKGQGKWVVWEDNDLYPTLAIELLSPSTEGRDRGQKFLIYRDQWKMGDYFLYDSEAEKLEGFHLKRRAYVSTQADPNDLHPCQTLPLKLGIHQGWLRWFTLEGDLVPTDEELNLQSSQMADEERARADQAEELLAQERERTQRLLERLKAMGVSFRRRLPETRRGVNPVR